MGRERLVWAVARLRAQLFNGPVEFGRGIALDPAARIRVGRATGERVRIGDYCQIHRGAILATYGGWIELGEHTTVNPYTVLYGHGGLSIGSHVRIAAHTVIVPANHVFADPERPIALQGFTAEGIVVDDDVWIGANATVLDGCRIGAGAVVAAGAVVTRDVAPSSIVAGVPARVVGRRGAE